MSWRRALWLCFCVGLIGRGAEEGAAEKGLYWYAADGRIALIEVSDYVTLQFAEGTPEARVRDLLRQEPGLAPLEQGWWIPSRQLLAARLRTLQSADDWVKLKTRLLTRPEVRRVYPVYSMQPPHILLLTDDFCVQFKPEVSAARIEALNKNYGVRIVKTLGFGPKAYVFRVEDPDRASALEVANAYQESGLVLFAHPDFIAKKRYYFTPNDPLYPNQWHLNSIGQGGARPDADVDAPEAWDLNRGSRAITIAILDDAIELTHEDFQAPNKLAPGWDFTGNDPDPGPDVPVGEEHGTSCAGVATAVHHNALGVSGIAPECKLMGLKYGVSFSDDAAAFTWVKEHGGDVMSNSWGYVGITSVPPVLQAAIDDLTDNGRGGLGTVVFFAAGNSNLPVSIDNVLAAYERCIAVAASTDQDVQAPYSSYGPEIDLCAPGNGGVTTGITTTDLMGSAGYASGNYTDDFGGTSASTPLACGVGALVLSANPKLTRLEVQEILQMTADKIDRAGGNYDSRGHSNLYGYGKVNAYAAVAEALRRAKTPQNLVFTIEENAVLTDKADVQVTLTGTYLDTASQVRFFARPGPADPKRPPADSDPGWGPWQPYQSPMQATLAIPQKNGKPVEGTTTLYCQARNNVGIGLEKPSDDIFLNFPPKAVGAVSRDDTRVSIFFDQPVDRTTGGQTGNYTITPVGGGAAVPIQSAVVSSRDPQVVELTTSSRPLGNFQVQISNVQDTNGAVIQPPDDVVPIETQWVTVQPGFPKFTSDFVFSPPTLGDLTGDGVPEAVMASQNGQVYGWQRSSFWQPGQPALGPSLVDLAGWPQTVGSGLQGSPAVGDVDGDGEAEVLVASNDGRLWAWNGDGSRVDMNRDGVAEWPRTLEAATAASPTLGDIDYDGQLEVIIGDRSGRLYAFNGDGSLVPGWPVLLGGPIASTAAVGDLEGDPGEEIVVGANDGFVYALRGDGTPLPGWGTYREAQGAHVPPQILPAPSKNTGASLEFLSPALLDRNGDGRLDTVVIGSRTGQIFGWNVAGQVSMTFATTGARAYSSPAVMDMDGDGSPELVFGTDTNKVCIFDSQGKLLYEKTVGGATLRGSPVVADIGYDALGLTGPEILVGAADGRLYGWNARQGWLAANNPAINPDVPGLSTLPQIQTVAQAALAVGDIDGDGRMEVVAGADQAYAWDLGPDTVHKVEWAMFGQGPRHPGWREAPFVPLDNVPPRLAWAEASKGTEVQARFSERVERASAEQTENYVITYLENSVVHLLPVSAAQLMSDGYTVRLTTGEQAQDTVYTLQARGVQDVVGNGAGSASTIQFLGKDTLPPVLVRAEGVDATHVDVLFSEDIDAATALALNNYTITPALTVQAAEFFDPASPQAPVAQNRVRLTTSVQAGGTAYRLRVDPSVTDKAHNPLSGGTTVTFSGVEGLPPRLEAIKVTRSQFFYLLFDEPVEKTSAETVLNYTVQAGPGQAALSVVTAQRGDSLGWTPADMAALGFPNADPRQLVKITTAPPQTREVRYTVTVQGVEDLFHNVIRGNNSLQFVGVDTIPPRVLSAVAPDVNHVDLIFSEELNQASAENENHFQIEPEPGPGPLLEVLAAALQADGKTVRLTTAAQTEGALYKVTVSNVADTAPVPNVIEPGSGDTVRFGAPSSNPVLVAAVQESEQSIILQFNKELAAATAQTVSNYVLETVAEEPSTVPLEGAQLLPDGRQVRLTTAEPLGESVLYRVTVTGVTDQQGNPVQSGDNTAQFRSTSAPPRALRAEVLGKTQVRITFSEPLDRASAEGPGNYLFTPSLTVQQARLEGNTVLLTTDPQRESTAYQIRVRNVLDLVGNPIVQGSGDVVGFISLAEPPELIAARGWGQHPTGDLDNRHVELDFNEPLQKLGAEDTANYTIQRVGTAEVLTIQRAVLASDGQKVQLLTSPQAEDAQYQASVRNVMDVAGNLINPQKSVAAFATPRVLPAPPTNVQAVATGGRIVVSWNSSREADVIGYQVYRADAPTGPFFQITETPVSQGSRPLYEDTTGTPAVQYWYKVAAIDSGPAPAEWRLSGVVSAVFPDGQAPQIVHQQPDGAVPSQALPLTATVTDNGQVAQVVLFYRTLGQASFRSVAMDRQAGSDLYAAAIPAEFVTGNGVEYYLQATDSASPSNTSTLPAGSRYFVVSLYATLAGRIEDLEGHGVQGVTLIARRSGEQKGQATTDAEGRYEFALLPPGEYELEIQREGYLVARQKVTLLPGESVAGRDVTLIQAPTIATPLALVSVPLDFKTPPLPGNVLGGASFLLSSWDAAAQNYVTYPHQTVRVERGRGYFVRTVQGMPKVVAEGTVPDLDQPVTVSAGNLWNLIGNPFPSTLALENVRVRLPEQSNAQAVDLATAAQRGWMKDFLWGYGPEGYYLVGDFAEIGGRDRLEAWKGYWLRAYRPLTLVIYGSFRPVPLEPAAPALSRSARATDGTIAIRLVATAGGVTDAFNIVGVAGSQRPHGLQIPSPPSLSPGVDLSILDAQGRAQAVDLQPAGRTEWTYDLVVRTDLAGEKVVIRWPDLTALPEGYSATLTDLQTRQTRAMRTTTHYTFTPSPDGSPRQLRLTIRRTSGTGFTISGLAVVSHKAEGVTSVAYNLSAPAEITLTVRTLTGQLVATVVQRVAQPGGLNQVTWDGRDAQGRRVPPGTYLCELVGVPEAGEMVKVVRTITQ